MPDPLVDVSDLVSIEDPEVQAEECCEAIKKAEDYLANVRAIRDEAIYAMAEAGKRPFAIATRLGMSKSGVTLIIRTLKKARVQ